MSIEIKTGDTCSLNDGYGILAEINEHIIKH